MFSDLEFWLPIAALVLDIVIGDPAGLPHPVRFLGKLIEKQESIGRKSFAGSLKMWGVGCTLFNAVLAFAVVKALCSIPTVGLFVAVYFTFAGLAFGQLMREGKAVGKALDKGDLSAARERLSGLVSRDVSELDEAGMRSALAETVSENLNDGVVAPFFYFALGGPALMWAYKAVSTMDSMWGYKNDEYRVLGSFCARADDLLAFIPARLTAFAMVGAGMVTGMKVPQALYKIADDAHKAASPNAGWPMAAAAWLAGARIGGPAVYHGEEVEKPYMGPEQGSWDNAALGRLNRLVFAAGILACAALQIYFFAAYGAGA